jgi:Cu(I)/Ag(I) efflux system membrane fusion protein
MTLVKADSEEEAALEEHSHQVFPDGHAPFKLTFQRQQMIGVQYGKVEKKPLFKSIEAAGRVAFDPELYTAQNEYLEALSQLERVKDSTIADVRHSARRMIESSKLRLKILGLSDKQIANLASRGTAGSNLLVPKVGENLWIYAEVYEIDLPNIQPGLESTITGESLGGKRITGKVASVDRVINPATRTAKVRIQVPNAKALLRPESYVDVTIHSPLGEQVTVPFNSVFDTGKQAWVFVANDQGNFDPRVITIKYRADDEIAVESGVSPGEKIVTSANFLIDSESRLKGVLAAQGDTPTEDQKPKQKTPECPKGQFWHSEMKHCMPKLGS